MTTKTIGGFWDKLKMMEVMHMGYLENGVIYAVDFDGTLSLGKWPEVGPANDNLIEFLKAKREQGDKMILWTCRQGDELKAAVKFCRDNGLEFDAINDNLPEVIELYGSNSRKISCDYYIDDRAILASEFNAS